MHFTTSESDQEIWKTDNSIGRIVSVTGSKAVVLLDAAQDGFRRGPEHRPEMGTLLVIEQTHTAVLAIVSALSVPVPAQREGDAELWIAELGLVGELWKGTSGHPGGFSRGVTTYPSLGDRVRVASKAELEMAFCGDRIGTVRVGSLRQDSGISAMIKVDDLLGKHFAILGTTGTGKSCTTALILRSILQKNPAAHIVLLDPHNEYATAFTEWAEVLSPRNMQLPFWLLTFEEALEVLIGDSQGRKAEVEILQELIPIAKARYAMGRAKENQALRRGALDPGRLTVDTPVPYRISDLMALIDERMGKLENKRDLHPYRQIKTRIDTISQDARYAFMFGSLTVYDGMAQILGQIFRVPVNDRPITILELTGLPTEIVNVVVSVLCRMTFDFALWSEGQVPVTLVCEEAHRYVPANPNLGFEPCKRAIAKIAKEGRKYGASLCIVTQRPAEIDPTILSQCNTVFALRMSNDRDQQIVQSAVSDTGSGLLEFLPALGQREAIAFGDGVTLPVRIKFDELPKSALPRSSTARFSEKWQKSVGDDGFLDQIVERWRASGAEMEIGGMMFADAVAPGAGSIAEPPVAVAAGPEGFGSRGRELPETARPAFQPSGPGLQRGPRRDLPHRGESGPGAPRSTQPSIRGVPPPPSPASESSQQTAEALRSLRDRLTRSNSTR
ncbi:MAG: ATP-binding protein [Hyphomicrobiaceae bacterium]|nr:ATP-binding protein [Hyphomicrobiaceae bacterium]